MTESWAIQFISHTGGGEQGSYTDKQHGKYSFVAPTQGTDTYKITYSKTDDEGHTGTGETYYSVNAGECVNCDCSKLSFTQTKTGTIPLGGYNGQLGTYSITHDYCKSQSPTVTAVNVSNIQNINVSNGVVSGLIPENTGAARTASFKLAYNGAPCDRASFSISQEAGYTCDDITFSQTTNAVPYYAQNNVVIGTYSNRGAGSVSVRSLTSGLSVRISGSQILGDFTEWSDETSSRILSFQFILNGTMPCSTYNVEQTQAKPNKWRVTDNGSDYLSGIWVSHPLNVNFEGGEQYNFDGDSIDAFTLAVKDKNGNWVPILTDDRSEITNAGYEATEVTYGGRTVYGNESIHGRNKQFVQINDWLSLCWETGYGWHNQTIGGIGFRYPIYSTSDQNSWRDVIFWLKTKDDVVAAWANPDRRGKDAAKEYQYQLRQAPNRRCWCGDHSYNQVPCDC